MSSAYWTVYEKVVRYLSSRIGKNVLVDGLQSELRAAESILQAVIDDLHESRLVEAQEAVANGERRAVSVLVKNAILREMGRYKPRSDEPHRETR